MMLDISEALRAPGAAIPFRHLEPLEPMDVLGQTVTYPEPAVVEGFFTLQDETLVITAQLRVWRWQTAPAAWTALPTAWMSRCMSFLREDPAIRRRRIPGRSAWCSAGTA